jgi:hypothetical protein
VKAIGDGTVAILGVTEHDQSKPAILGISENWVGVQGVSKIGHSAIWGNATAMPGFGVWGNTSGDDDIQISAGAAGLVGGSEAWLGVYGQNGTRWLT